MTTSSLEPASRLRTRILPIAEILLVSAIWGSSFVGVKAALNHAGPLTIAALRYSIAAALLLPFVPWQRLRRVKAPARVWLQLTAIGLSQYTIGNGALFLALRSVSSTAASLMLSLCPIPVWVFGAIALGERPSRWQVLGTVAAIGGSILFFGAGLTAAPASAIALLSLAILSFAVLPVVGRRLSRERSLGNIGLTGIPLAIGGGTLWIIAAAVEGLPRLPAATWLIILGLALVNTLGGYLLFNHALHRLRAGEANVLLSLTPISTALIAWAAFGDRLGTVQLLAMGIVISGAALSQWRTGVRAD